MEKVSCIYWSHMSCRCHRGYHDLLLKMSDLYFRTNLETSGNLSKCFVCIGSIFQIGYTLLQRTKARVTMVIHYLCNNAWSIFLLWQNLKGHIMPFENKEKKIQFAVGNFLTLVFPQKVQMAKKYEGFHLYLSELAFINQFCSRLTSLFQMSVAYD